MSKEEKVRYWEAIIKKHASSGLSAAAFCRDQDINVSQFRWWQRRFKKENTKGKESGFLKLVACSNPLHSGIRIRINAKVSVEVEQGFDPHALRNVIEAISGGEIKPCSH